LHKSATRNKLNWGSGAPGIAQEGSRVKARSWFPVVLRLFLIFSEKRQSWKFFSRCGGPDSFEFFREEEL
jgi:hypothetical protein